MDLRLRTNPRQTETFVDKVARYIVDAFTSGAHRHYSVRVKSLSTTRNSRLQQVSARLGIAHKTIGQTTFRFEPSAINSRYNVSIETGTPPYIKFGAVLTRREVQTLIECLSAGLQGSIEEDGQSS